MKRSTAWRSASLWDEGDRDDEPGGVDLHPQCVWSVPGVSNLETMPLERVLARAQNNEAKEPRRRGPQGPCSDVELIQKIREVLQQSPFHGEGYRKVWAKLRYKGIRTSRRRVPAVDAPGRFAAFQRLGNPRGSKAHEGTILKEEPDQMWGTDMTSTWTGQGQACLFVAVDHCTGECIGIHASRSGNRWQALEPLRQG